MARNGSGTYVRVSGTPYVYNTVISETTVNSEMDDIATALTSSIAKDGQTTPTANLPMGTYRHTGVGNGSARTDYAAMGQVQDGKVNWVDGGGTADAITATYSPAITALVDGQLCFVRATAANATTTPTFAPNGLTARTIVKNGGSALVAGDIVGDGHELQLRYDLANTRWELLNPGAYAASGAATSSGLTMATSRLLGRTTASTGAIEELTLSSALDLIGSAAQGDILYRDSTGWSRLGAGTSGYFLKTQGAAANPAWAQVATITLGTPQATTSGTSFDFTGIPAGTKQITISFRGVSLSGTSFVEVQLGDSGGIETSGYSGAVSQLANASAVAVANISSGFAVDAFASAAVLRHGTMTLTLESSSAGAWAASGICASSGTTAIAFSAGTKVLTGDGLTQLRIKSNNGTDTFDAGEINIAYQ